MSKMRYRKPSAKTLLGVTKWKKRIKKALGINTLLWPFRAVNNYQRRMLRRAGYYSPQMKMMRAMKRGQVAGPVGPLQVGEHAGEHAPGERGQQGSSLLMAAMLAKGMEGEPAKGHKPHEDASPNLVQAMLLASALKDAPGKRAPKATEDSSAKAHAKAEPKAKRRRGTRLIGLLLMALLTAVGIFTAWYFWLA